MNESGDTTPLLRPIFGSKNSALFGYWRMLFSLPLNKKDLNRSWGLQNLIDSQTFWAKVSHSDVTRSPFEATKMLNAVKRPRAVCWLPKNHTEDEVDQHELTLTWPSCVMYCSLTAQQIPVRFLQDLRLHVDAWSSGSVGITYNALKVCPFDVPRFESSSRSSFSMFFKWRRADRVAPEGPRR